MSQPIITQHSSHLWISDSVTNEEQTVSNLQKTFCLNNSCSKCTTCIQIQNKTHPWISWLQPENAYTIEQIDQVIHSVQFSLTKEERRFFIFAHAEELTPTCCNRLLKTIEEPHAGYHFVFLTNQPEEILPTLRSRCFAQSFASQSIKHCYQELIDPLLSLTCNKPTAFMKLVDKHEIKERKTKEVIDILLERFYIKFKESASIPERKQQSFLYLDIIILIKESIKKLPLPGSAKIFWKNFYLSFHQLVSCSKK